MSLEHIRPDEALERELVDVSRDAEALLEFLRAPNIAIPDTFPASQLADICKSLRELPQGTAEGCRAPLEYARVRLPAIRREHILSEDQVPLFEEEEEVPRLIRGMGLDRLVRDLIASVTTALDEYRRQATEHFDDTVGPERIVDNPRDTSIRAALATSRSLEIRLRDAADEIRETTVSDSSRADRLLRTIKDAEIVNRVARAELGMRSIVLRWYRAVAEAVKQYPGLIQRFGAAIKLGVDVAEPFFKRWHDFEGNLLKFALNELNKTAQTFVEVGHRLERRRAGALDKRREEEIRPDQTKAERDARELILAGKPVPPEIVPLVKRLDLSGNRGAHTKVPDFDLVSQLQNVTGLDLRYSDVETLDFLVKMKHLTWLHVHGREVNDISSLTRLTALTSLGISCSEETNLSAIERLED